MAVTSAWAWKCPLTIDHTQVIEDIPYATIKLLAANFPAGLFTYAKAAGADIRFTSDSAGATELSFEIVLYATSPSNLAMIYVLVPNLSSSVDTTIYVWYGNSAANAYAATDTYGRNSVWTTTSYVHVHHFQEASGTLVNSTGDATYDGTSTAITYREAQGDGTYCIRFTAASNSRVALGGNSLNSGTTRTAQGWIWVNSLTAGSGLGRILSNESGGNGFFFKVVNSSGGYIATIAMDTVYGANNAIAAGAWYYAAVSRTAANPGIWNFYVNGVLTGTANQSQATAAGGNESFGCRGDGTTDRNFDGWMAGQRVSNAVQSANALLTAYNNESNPSSFSAAGTPVVTGNWFLLPDKNLLYNTMRGLDR